MMAATRLPVTWPAGGPRLARVAAWHRRRLVQPTGQLVRKKHAARGVEFCAESSVIIQLNLLLMGNKKHIKTSNGNKNTFENMTSVWQQSLGHFFLLICCFVLCIIYEMRPLLSFLRKWKIFQVLKKFLPNVSFVDVCSATGQQSVATLVNFVALAKSAIKLSIVVNTSAENVQFCK